MKMLIVILITAFLAGCSLSRGTHLILLGQDGERSDSACGYFDNSIKFGAENKVLISSEDVVLSVCSIDHHSKVIAKGVVIPLYPVDGYEVIKPYRWIKLTNSGPEPVFITSPSNMIKVAFQRYPDSDASTLEDLDHAELSIPPGKHAWVGFSDKVPFSLGIKTSSQDIALQFREAFSYSWYMATH